MLKQNEMDDILNHFNPHKPAVLMCKPDYFKVLGPDQDGKFYNDQSKAGWQIYQKDPKGYLEKAHEQWQALKSTLEDKCGLQIILIEPRQSLADQCFTADASVSLVDKYNHTTFISCFTHPLRQVEAQYHHATLLKIFPETRFIPFESPFEGSGDNLYDRFRDVYWSGYATVHGQPAEGRSEQRSHQLLQKETGVRVISIEVHRPFFHIDTCFTCLNDGHLIVYPDGMSKSSYETVIQEGIKAFGLSKDDFLIEVSKEEAMQYVCNIVHIDNNIVMQKSNSKISNRLSALGYNVYEVDLSHFIYAGGGPHCLVNYVNQSRNQQKAIRG